MKLLCYGFNLDRIKVYKKLMRRFFKLKYERLEWGNAIELISKIEKYPRISHNFMWQVKEDMLGRQVDWKLRVEKFLWILPHMCITNMFPIQIWYYGSECSVWSTCHYMYYTLADDNLD